MRTFNKLILTFLLMFAVNISAQGVFYLHDLLEDAFMRLKSIKK